jgi:energy-coupling factor transport system substrate-specific component
MKNTKKLIIAAFGIVINVVLGSVTSWLSIPLLFLDTMGTIYVAANVGMGFGILTGICTNLVMGITTGPTAIPFALVNVAVAIVVALMAKNGFTLIKSIIAGLILSIVCPLIGTPIRLILFGGFTGSGTDLLILALKAAGQEIFAATFISTIAGNLVDKIVSCIAVALLMRYLPERVTGIKKPDKANVG